MTPEQQPTKKELQESLASVMSKIDEIKKQINENKSKIEIENKSKIEIENKKNEEEQLKEGEVMPDPQKNITHSKGDIFGAFDEFLGKTKKVSAETIKTKKREEMKKAEDIVFKELPKDKKTDNTQKMDKEKNSNQEEKPKPKYEFVMEPLSPEPEPEAEPPDFDLIKPEIEEEFLPAPDEKEAKEIFDKLPEQDKEKIGWGISTIGFSVEQKKNNFFAKTFNWLAETNLEKNKTTSRFCKNLGKGFQEDAERAFQKAEKIKNKEEKHRRENAALLFGNITRYGRMITDFTGASFASPLRYVMMVGMAISRGAKAGTETRLENEELIEKTRIQDAQKAEEEAWKIYEIAKKKENSKNVSVDALKKAYLSEIPKDLQKRLSEPSTANNFIQNTLRKSFERGINRINKKINEIENDKMSSTEDKNRKIENILNKYKQKLSDYDRMLTQIGTIDELAMGGRIAQRGGQLIVGVATVETLALSLEKLYSMVSHIFSEPSLITPINNLGSAEHALKLNSSTEDTLKLNPDLKKGIVADVLKTRQSDVLKTEASSKNILSKIIEGKNQNTTQSSVVENKNIDLKNTIEQKDSSKAGVGVKDIKPKTGMKSEDLQKTTDLKNKILEQFKIKEGEGYQNSFIRQIEGNSELATKLGFDGDINDKEALHEFAGKQAHIISINVGIVGKEGEETWVTEGNKIAPVLKMEDGKVVVEIKNIENGEQIETLRRGDKFGENLNKYEKIHAETSPETTTKEISQQDHIETEAEENEIILNEKEINPIKTNIEEIKTTKEYSKDHIIEYDDTSKPTGSINNEVLNSEQLKEINEIHQANINHLISNENLSLNEKMELTSILKEDKATDIIKYKSEDLKNVFRPLIEYMNKLHRITGLEPIEETRLTPAETVENYFYRAEMKAAELKKLSELKLTK